MSLGDAMEDYRRLVGGALRVVIVGLLLCGVARAQTITVDTLDDVADPPFDADGFCGVGTIAELPGADGRISLREAIIAANNTLQAQTIRFAETLRGGTIHISFDDLDADALPDGLPLLCGGSTTITGDFDGDGGQDIILDGSGLADNVTAVLVVSSNNVVNGLDVRNAPFAGVGVLHIATQTSYTSLSNNRISNNHVSGSNYGIFVIAGSTAPVSPGVIAGTTIIGNTIADTTLYDGVFISTSPTAGSMISDTTIVGNRVQTAQRNGVSLLASYFADGSNTSIIETTIRDNEMIENLQAGIFAAGFGGPGHAIRGVDISGNTVRTNGSNGISLNGGVCGATDCVLDATVAGNIARDNGQSDNGFGIAVIGGANYACPADPPRPAEQNRVTVTLDRNILEGNRGGHINLSGGLVGANHNMLAATVTENMMTGGLVGIALSGGVGTVGDQTAPADSNMVRAALSGNRAVGTLGGLLLSGGNGGPASSNRVDLVVEDNFSCRSPVADISCVGGFTGVAGFPPNTGTGNVVAGVIRGNEASVVLADAGVPGNTCEATVENNRVCGAPTPTPTPPPVPCVGDCDGSDDVSIDELLTMVNVALEIAAPTVCTAGDANHDGTITVEEVLNAVNRALNGC